MAPNMTGIEQYFVCSFERSYQLWDFSPAISTTDCRSQVLVAAIKILLDRNKSCRVRLSAGKSWPSGTPHNCFEAGLVNPVDRLTRAKAYWRPDTNFDHDQMIGQDVTDFRMKPPLFL